jgi:prophage regulatory protein
MVDTFMKVPAVLEAAGVNKSTLYKMIRAGQFPRPVKPNDDRMVRWLESEVAAWQKARILARDDAKAA